jgi:hypothetical protein
MPYVNIYTEMPIGRNFTTYYNLIKKFYNFRKKITTLENFLQL